MKNMKMETVMFGSQTTIKLQMLTKLAVPPFAQAMARDFRVERLLPKVWR